MDSHSFVEATDGTRLAVSEDGPPDAPLTMVFSHGLALSQHIWGPQRRHLNMHLGERVRKVFYDQRGHGNSEEPATGRDGYTLAQIGDDLSTVISRTCPHGPVVAVGHSLGGMAIMSMAHHHPDVAARLAGVALISTASHELSTAGIGRVLSTPAVSLLEHIVEYAPGLTHHVWSLARGLAGPLLGIPVTRVVSRADGASIRAVVGLLTALREHDETAGLDILRSLPACLVACGDADPVTPISHSVKMCDKLPQARLLRAPRAGHMLPLERPRLINTALTELAEDALLGVAASASLLPA